MDLEQVISQHVGHVGIGYGGTVRWCNLHSILEQQDIGKRNQGTWAVFILHDNFGITTTPHNVFDGPLCIVMDISSSQALRELCIGINLLLSMGRRGRGRVCGAIRPDRSRGDRRGRRSCEVVERLCNA